MRLLRADALIGRAVVLAGGGPPGLGAELEAYGAQLVASGDEPAPTALVFDGGPAFGDGGQNGLTRVLDDAWASVSEFAPSLIERGKGGKLVLIAPARGAGPLAEAARAGLENLARTLSIEWARHAITTCAVLPGDATSGDEVAQLVCFLLSAAGDYFSGCRIEFGAVTARS